MGSFREHLWTVSGSPYGQFQGASGFTSPSVLLCFSGLCLRLGLSPLFSLLTSEGLPGLAADFSYVWTLQRGHEALCNILQSPSSLIGQQMLCGGQFLLMVTHQTGSPAELSVRVGEPQLGFHWVPAGVIRFGQGTVRTSPKMKIGDFSSPAKKLSNSGGLSRYENFPVYQPLLVEVILKQNKTNSDKTWEPSAPLGLLGHPHCSGGR